MRPRWARGRLSWPTWRRWWIVARLTMRDARRSRGLVSVVVLFAGLAFAASVLPELAVDGPLSARQALVFLVAPLKLLVALTALLAGYGAIAGLRSGGQLVLVLSLPVDRTALVAGSFIGRSIVTLGGVTVGLTIATVTMAAMYGDLPGRILASFGILVALLAVTVTALAVGLSAAASTRGRAAIGAVGAFVLFEFFWGVVPAGAYYVMEGSLPGPVVPGWVVLLERIQPLSAFETTATALLPTVGDAVQLSPGGMATAETAPSRGLADRLSGPRPAYLDPRGGVATLLAWTVGSLLVGWYRFARADL